MSESITRATGILIHVRHLETVGWKRLVWGVPEEGSLGSLPKVAELLLDCRGGEPPVIVLGCGPSSSNGLTEGEYTKQYFLKNLRRLSEFPKLRDRISPDTLGYLEERVQNIIVTPEIKRSIDEIAKAADIFAQYGATKIVHVTAASHAPRCIQLQSAARQQGLIPGNQQWFLVADDRCYENADSFSTIVIEPPHRGDDPMLDVTPSMSEALRDYQYGLTPEQKRELIETIASYTQKHADKTKLKAIAANHETA